MRRVAVLAALAVVSGCGGGGEERTRAAWAAEANEICRVHERRIASLGTPATPAAAEAFLRRAVPVARDEVRALRALERPEADAARIDRMLDTADRGIDALAGVVRAREAGDEAAVREATARGRRAAAASSRIARELGATDCAS